MDDQQWNILGTTVTKEAFSGPDPDVYDPGHTLNYGLKEWGESYQSFYRCMTSLSEMAWEDCKQLDSFFQEVMKEEK